MPLLFIAALAGSLSLHVVALFGVNYELFGEESDAPVLQAELRQPPPAAVPQALAPAEARPRPRPRPAAAKPPPARVAPQPAPADPPAGSHQEDAAPPVVPVAAVADSVAGSAGDAADHAPGDTTDDAGEPTTTAADSPPAQPILPSQGGLRYALYAEDLGMQIGRVEQSWEFAADGSYLLRSRSETSGLASLFKPLRVEYESRGRLTAQGLQPVQFRTLKNGRESRENADFDWSTGSVTLARDGRARPLTPGSQDILSLNYQLAYLANPEAGSRIGVVSGRQYRRHDLDSLGEEMLETPAGRFRTLHLRAASDTLTEIWIALDHHRLPVRIRFTDKKGESYEQLLTEFVSDPAALSASGNP